MDVTAVTFSGIYDGYWYLDPTTLYGTYEDYNYFGVNVGASNIYGKNATQYLQPGQAFFVCSNSASPSVTFTESAKSNSTSQSAIFGASNKLNRIATGLFTNGKNVDGAVTVFNSSFSDGLSKEDGLKINNHGENLTFTIEGKDLCANGMSLPKATDELPLHLFQLNTNTAYSLRLDVSQFVGNGLIAYLKDNLSNTTTQLTGDSNIVSFKTNTETSIYSNRYSIVFTPSSLPLKTISLTASQLQGTQVSIKWSVVGENGIASYKVEHSTNGTNFTDLTSISPAATNNYSYIDATANEGINYYRIKATDNAGTISYSKVVSCQLSIANYQLSIAPNPVTNGSFNLTIGNTGKYIVVLLDKLGQTVYKTTINHTVATALENVTLGKKLAAGSYTVTVRGEDGKVLSKEIIIN